MITNLYYKIIIFYWHIRNHISEIANARRDKRKKSRFKNRKKIDDFHSDGVCI